MIAIIIILLVMFFAFTNFREKRELYFDNNAHTMPEKAVVNAVNNAMYLHNASAAYGEKEKKLIDTFCDKILGVLNWRGTCIITSGASESNALITNSFKTLCSDFEHKSMFGKATVVKTSPLGPRACDFGRYLVSENASSENLFSGRGNLISVMTCNNETGDVYDINGIANVAHSHGLLFHTDATQYFGKMILSRGNRENQPVFENVDFITISFHKMGGPLGVGVLVCRNDLARLITPIITGTQNTGLRGGTENLPAIAGALKSMEICFHNRALKNEHLRNLCSYFCEVLMRHRDLITLANLFDNLKNLKAKERNKIMFLSRNSFNTVLVSFINISDKTRFCNIKFRKALQDRNVKISIGSACNTAVTGPSHVLMAMELPFIVRCGVLRFSFGDHTTFADIDEFEKRCKDLLC